MADRGDDLLWHKDLKPHSSGDFSIAVVQANLSLEDQGQVLNSPFGTYVGVYDGHGGPEASRFINNHLFPHMETERLSTEHNVAVEEVRKELKALHPDDSHIVVLRHGVWRVKGIIQVSRSIGDIYLKKPEFNRDPLFAQFGFPVPLQRPVMTAEPSILVRQIKPQDLFVIFASDGLWEQLSDKVAVDIVHSNPRTGIAKRLVRAALQEAAKKREMRYADLKKIERGVRRHFHDDITVIVILFGPPIDQHAVKVSSEIQERCRLHLCSYKYILL